MKDKGIDSKLLQDIDTDKPQFRGFQSIRKLFWKYLNILGVPFNDPCCPGASTASPGGSSYLVYTAILTHDDNTDPPDAIILQNTLGVSVTWTYHGPAFFYADIPGGFNPLKTWVMIQNSNAAQSGSVYFASYDIDSGTLGLVTQADDTANQNGWDAPLYIEIRVYP